MTTTTHALTRALRTILDRGKRPRHQRREVGATVQFLRVVSAWFRNTKVLAIADGVYVR